jgi:hypothetical protein
MSPASPLENLLYARRFDDGLLDLFVGVGLILIGLAWMLDAPVYSALAPAVLVPMWMPLRERWVERRLAAVRFSDERENETRGSMIGWLIFGACVLLTALVVVLFAGRGEASILERLDDAIVALPSALVATGLLAALMIGAWRFAGYAAASLAIGGVGVVRGVEEPGILILATGILVMCAAAALLVRFFKTHPLTDVDDQDHSNAV